jgi:hypothetical protein
MDDMGWRLFKINKNMSTTTIVIFLTAAFINTLTLIWAFVLAVKERPKKNIAAVMTIQIIIVSIMWAVWFGYINR